LTLARANRQSLNVAGSFQHILTDLYAFIATAIAGAVIIWTGFVRADAIASVLVAALMFRAAFGLLKDSGRVFLEAAPEGVDVQAIGEALAAQPGVNEVHDLHVWEVTSGFPALSAHLIVARDAEHDPILHDAEQLLGERFKIAHCTLQIDVDHARGLVIHKRGCPEASPRTAPISGTDGVTVRGAAPESDT
jgi:cobalt-zinc-cadmium efflux system protein